MIFEKPSDYLVRFKKKYPTKEVMLMYSVGNGIVLIEAPEKGFKGDEDAITSFLMTNKGVVKEIDPSWDIEAYTKMHNPKNLIFEKE